MQGMKSFVQALAIILAVCATTAHAHLLNMTEVTLTAQDQGISQLDVRIDLGQSLMRPENYWRAVQWSKDMVAGSDLWASLPAIERLRAGLEVLVNRSRAPLRLIDIKLNATSLDAIRNPLTPQMAVLRFEVPASVGDSVEVRLVDDLEIPWPCLLRVDVPGADLPVSRLLTADTRSSRPVLLSASAQPEHVPWAAGVASTWQSWLPGISWLVVGYQHVVPLGLDHIVFVLGLFFLAAKFSTLLWQVSCFTLAHSLTLALASAGVVNISATVIEPLIAASILYIAFDNLYSDGLAKGRLAVVTVFGLLHGLGFASALGELQLPAESFLSSLLLFNLGVELAQLTVLAGAFLTVGWLQRWSGYQRQVARPATITIAGVGAYWLAKRVMF